MLKIDGERVESGGMEEGRSRGASGSAKRYCTSGAGQARDRVSQS